MTGDDEFKNTDNSLEGIANGLTDAAAGAAAPGAAQPAQLPELSPYEKTLLRVVGNPNIKDLKLLNDAVELYTRLGTPEKAIGLVERIAEITDANEEKRSAEASVKPAAGKRQYTLPATSIADAVDKIGELGKSAAPYAKQAVKYVGEKIPPAGELKTTGIEALVTLFKKLDPSYIGGWFEDKANKVGTSIARITKPIAKKAVEKAIAEIDPLVAKGKLTEAALIAYHCEDPRAEKLLTSAFKQLEVKKDYVTGRWLAEETGHSDIAREFGYKIGQ